MMKTCNKKEYIRGAYDSYTNKAGLPLYPKEDINFREHWFVNGEWKDGAETHLAWTHYGSHHLEASAEAGTAFVIRTNAVSALGVRNGFSKVGADMFFDASQAPVMIETPDGLKLWRSKVDVATWQYWKFVWRSSLFLKITLVDHLWATHFTASNSLAGATRESLPAEHPFRRLMTLFTYGTINVNIDAFHQLLGPNALLQRSAPFADFQQVAKAARTAIPSLKSRFDVFVDEAARQALPTEVQNTPFMQDGQVLFDAERQLVDGWFD